MTDHWTESRRKNEDKSEFDLVILREQTKNRSDDPDNHVALALLHQHQVDREERRLFVAWVAVVVAAIGILVAIGGIWEHYRTYSHPVTPSVSTSSQPAPPASNP